MASPSLLAAWGEERFDPTQVEQWRESDVTLPAYPQERDLAAMPMEPADTLKVYVDRASVTRAADGVLRFTLVVESAQGVRNVLYEGLRCETREYKTYALGVGGKLEPARQASWQPITYLSQNAFRWQLLKFHACDASVSAARTPREFLDTLKP